MSIGLQLYTLRSLCTDIPATLTALKKARSIGYESVQMGIPKGLSAPALREELDRIGLAMLTVGPEGGLLGLLADPEPTLAVAEALGVAEVGCDTILESLRNTEEGYHTFARLMNKAAAPLRQAGLKLQYHNHALELCRFSSGKTGLDILLEETDPACVSFCLDTHWLQAGGVNPPDAIRRFRGRMAQVHFKDYGIDVGVEVREWTPRIFREVGLGNLDWPKIAEACRDIGVQHVIVEQDECKGDPYQSIAISLATIRSLGL